MVSWISSPFFNNAPGFTGGFRRFPISASQPVQAVFDAYGYKLWTPGTVDLNGITRFQYYVASQDAPVFVGGAAFRYTSADVAANPGRTLTGTAFLAPATAFAAGVVPTPAQIIAAATQVTRGQGAAGPPNGLTAAGDIALLFAPADGQAFPPNSKYWFLAAPTSVASMASTPSIANDIPVGDVNVNGRAVSLWTNRTPLAPTILSPGAKTTAFPGSEVTLTFRPNDPDKVSTFPGDVGPTDFDDMAGLQIQFRQRPTTANPSPTWLDLPIASPTGTDFGLGWYIAESVNAEPNTGARVFWTSYKLKIRCGHRNPLAPNAAYLSSGDWEIRMRTFDYGHPFPDQDNASPGPRIPPLADNSRTASPNTYPAVNTSPWSESVSISISSQVPKPVALSPTDNVAMVSGNDIALSWQYRNTYSPPFPQSRRIVQLQRVGEVGWFTLVDDTLPDTTYTINAEDLLPGTQYAWRVQVMDSSGEFSEYSDPAYFWVVPAPASGSVIPTPADTIEGATLGCGRHRVFIYRRGGQKRVGEITGFSTLTWGRLRDDISTSRIEVNSWGVDCGNLLARLEPWAYEIVIFRNNGYGDVRVWEGPITLITYENERVVINAKDVIAYLYRRILKQAMSDTGNSITAGSTVVNRAARVVQNALAVDDPNLLQYLHVFHRDDDAKQYRSLPAYSRTAYEEVDDMAANAGLDYTAVGRAIILWGTKHRIGTLPEFRDEDLGNSPIVSVYGMSMANRYAISDGNGIYGEATRLDENGEDPIYGLVEMLSSTWASDSASDSGTYTEAGLATVRESFAEAAERSIGDRYPVPVVVRVPDNTRINPDTVIDIQHLVPGVVIPLRSSSTLRTVVASQKLDSITVTETAGEETVNVTMSPFSRDDNEAGGEE